MREFMYGAGFATGVLITGLLIITWALRREYVPLKDRPLSDGDWVEWIVEPDYSTTLN